MPKDSEPENLACLIAGRNLGDIVVHSEFFRRLASRNYAKRYIVWTRPQLAFLFLDIPNCEVICSQFPVGTAKQFNGGTAAAFFKAAMAIRRQRPDVTLDLVGDFRERWFARLAGSRRHVHIGWERDHPFAQLIRNPFGSGRPIVRVPVIVANAYSAYQIMLDILAPGRNDRQAAMAVSRSSVSRAGAMRVGLHPFASQPSKLWPAENWRIVARELLSRGVELNAFAAPNELTAAQSLFSEFGPRVSIFTGTISEFAHALTNLDILIGLDSFSVHMAHRQGVRSITINAGTPTELWAVPSGRTLGGAGGCAYYPCYNIAKCQNTAYENACVRSVSPSDVLNAIKSIDGGRQMSDLCAGSR